MKSIITWLVAILFSITFWTAVYTAYKLWPLAVLTASGGVAVLVVVSVVSAKVTN